MTQEQYSIELKLKAAGLWSWLDNAPKKRENMTQEQRDKYYAILKESKK